MMVIANICMNFIRPHENYFRSSALANFEILQKADLGKDLLWEAVGEFMQLIVRTVAYSSSNPPTVLNLALFFKSKIVTKKTRGVVIKMAQKFSFGLTFFRG